MQHAIRRAINTTLINTVVMNIPQSATPATISGFDAGLRTTFHVVLACRNKKVEAVHTAATSDLVFRSVKIKRTAECVTTSLIINGVENSVWKCRF